MLQRNLFYGERGTYKRSCVVARADCRSTAVVMIILSVLILEGDHMECILLVVVRAPEPTLLEVGERGATMPSYSGLQLTLPSIARKKSLPATAT